MDSELEEVVLQVSQAIHPEELFGSEDVVLPPDFLHGYLNKRLDVLKAKLNPDNYVAIDDRDAAREMLEKLLRLEAAARGRINSYVYGMAGWRGHKGRQSAARSFVLGARECFVGNRISKSEGVSEFEGYLEQNGKPVGEVTIKLAETPADNHLVNNEDRILALLHEVTDVSALAWKHLPVILGRFEARDRTGIMFRKVSGLTLTEVRKLRAHRAGVDQKHMVWILNRCLKCLSYVHSQGILHGNLTPESILIQPTTHNAIIMNWSAAVHRPAMTKERVTYGSETFSAPETKARGKIGPWSDLYSLGKIMIWLLGGNPDENQISDGVEKAIRDLLCRMAQDDPYARPKDAEKLRGELARVRDGLWPRRFLHFDAT